MDLTTLARRYDALEKIDGIGFQRRARVLQSIWRSEQGLAMGARTVRGRTVMMGSMLDENRPEELLYANFITPAARAAAQRELAANARGNGGLMERRRMLHNLLSSQPLCFNLFAELERDFDLCSRVMGNVTRGRVQRVTRVSFEYAPARRDRRYLNDRTAFDVYIEYVGAHDRRGFLGIEVKYHETLRGVDAGEGNPRYLDVAHAAGCFRPDAIAMWTQPLHQIWRDHLLACSMLQNGALGFDEGAFVFLYPRDNSRCTAAWGDYLSRLSDPATAIGMTLEDFCRVIQSHTADRWIGDLVDRYLAFEKLGAAR